MTVVVVVVVVARGLGWEAFLLEEVLEFHDDLGANEGTKEGREGGRKQVHNLETTTTTTTKDVGSCMNRQAIWHLAFGICAFSISGHANAQMLMHKCKCTNDNAQMIMHKC